MQDPSKPKVLYELAGKPLISYVIESAQTLSPQKIIVITGYARVQVEEFIRTQYPNVLFAVQEQQLGTGHAVNQSKELLSNFYGNILILFGDVPLTKPETLQHFINDFLSSDAQASILTTVVPDPTGYGRIVRSNDNLSLASIVEERDASDTVKQINEINSGICIIRSEILFPMLEMLRADNAQGEYYLTDIFQEIVGRYGSNAVRLVICPDPQEVEGINTKDQLERLEKAYYASLQT
jgi:UDP-N-acetylglucosamine diphosphorylase/glucosamine-1-phosphate N-acetyltransferase